MLSWKQLTSDDFTHNLNVDPALVLRPSCVPEKVGVNENDIPIKRGPGIAQLV